MIKKQGTLMLSPYAELYDIVVPAGHFLRRLREDIDFSFIFDELACKYSPDMGRGAYDPVMMFKYLMLKVISQLSDEDLMEEARVNMAYKYFLGLEPEAMPADPTTLCKFRRQRLKDTDLLDTLLRKTFEMAEDKGIMARDMKDGKIHVRAIIDGTHTVSYASLYRPVPALKDWSRKLRRQLYECMPELKGSVANDRGISSTDLDGEIAYARQLVEFTRGLGRVAELPRVKRVLNRFAELVDDILDHYTCSAADPDARVGHKTADTEFFGYKTQIVEDADTELVLAASVTSGEVGDALPGKEAVEAVLAVDDLAVDELIGDTAYSGQPFLEQARDGHFELLAPPHPNLGASIDGRGGFTFNKDADRFVCPKGHLAVSKRTVTYKRDNNRKSHIYLFDENKCGVCPIRGECIKGKKAKARTFSVTALSPEQDDLLERSRTEDFKQRRKERYKIEAKNAHLKRGLGYGRTMGKGIGMMELQAAVTLFVSNIKKIYAKMAKKD